MTNLIRIDGSELTTMAAQAKMLKEFDAIAKDAKANADHIKKHIKLNSGLKWFTHGIIAKLVNSTRRDADALEALARKHGATDAEIKDCATTSATTRITIQ